MRGISRMIEFFDYIFFRVSGFYRRKWGEKDPDRYGFGMAYIALSLTLVDLYVGFVLVAGPKYGTYLEPVGYGVCIACAIFCFIRYGRSRLKQLDARWHDEPKSTRSRKRTYTTLYVVFVILFGFMYVPLRHLIYGK